MDWATFWTILAQVIIATLTVRLLVIPWIGLFTTKDTEHENRTERIL